MFEKMKGLGSDLRSLVQHRLKLEEVDHVVDSLDAEMLASRRSIRALEKRAVDTERELKRLRELLDGHVTAIPPKYLPLTKRIAVVEAKLDSLMELTERASAVVPTVHDINEALQDAENRIQEIEALVVP